MSRFKVAVIFTAMLTVLGMLSVAPAVASQDNATDHRVVICHRTDGVTNPYVRITVDEAMVNGVADEPGAGQGDHLLGHQGPVATSEEVAQALQDDHESWGDIIPPIYKDGSERLGGTLNWAEGQAIWENGCAYVGTTPTGSITLTKFIPVVVEGNESYTISFEIKDFGGNVLTPDTSCDFVFTADTDMKVNPAAGGEEQFYQTCSISNLPYGTYTIHEVPNSDGWAPVDDVTVTIPDGEGGTNIVVDVTNSFGLATAQVCKITTWVNADGYTGADRWFRFTISDGTTSENVFVQGGGTAGNPNCVSFELGLKDNVSYTVTESAHAYTDATGSSYNDLGWAFGSVSCTVTQRGSVLAAGNPFRPQYPNNGAAVYACTATGTRTFSTPLTPGYWKTHLSQAAKHFPVYLGGYKVDSNAKVTNVFNAMNCNNLTTGNNAAGCLPGHLLATKLNLRNGVDGTNVGQWVSKADGLLTGQAVTVNEVTVTGINYTGPGNYTLSAKVRAAMIYVKNHLDSFNNGSGAG